MSKRKAPPGEESKSRLVGVKFAAVANTVVVGVLREGQSEIRIFDGDNPLSVSSLHPIAQSVDFMPYRTSVITSMNRELFVEMNWPEATEISNVGMLWSPSDQCYVTDPRRLSPDKMCVFADWTLVSTTHDMLEVSGAGRVARHLVSKGVKAMALYDRIVAFVDGEFALVIWDSQTDVKTRHELKTQPKAICLTRTHVFAFGDSSEEFMPVRTVEVAAMIRPLRLHFGGMLADLIGSDPPPGGPVPTTRHHLEEIIVHANLIKSANRTPDSAGFSRTNCMTAVAAGEPTFINQITLVDDFSMLLVQIRGEWMRFDQALWQWWNRQPILFSRAHDDKFHNKLVMCEDAFNLAEALFTSLHPAQMLTHDECPRIILSRHGPMRVGCVYPLRRAFARAMFDWEPVDLVSTLSSSGSNITEKLTSFKSVVDLNVVPEINRFYDPSDPIDRKVPERALGFLNRANYFVCEAAERLIEGDSNTIEVKREVAEFQSQAQTRRGFGQAAKTIRAPSEKRQVLEPLTLRSTNVREWKQDQIDKFAAHKEWMFDCFMSALHIPNVDYSSTVEVKRGLVVPKVILSLERNGPFHAPQTFFMKLPPPLQSQFTWTVEGVKSMLAVSIVGSFVLRPGMRSELDTSFKLICSPLARALQVDPGHAVIQELETTWDSWRLRVRELPASLTQTAPLNTLKFDHIMGALKLTHLFPLGLMCEYLRVSRNRELYMSITKFTEAKDIPHLSLPHMLPLFSMRRIRKMINDEMLTQRIFSIPIFSAGFNAIDPLSAVIGLIQPGGGMTSVWILYAAAAVAYPLVNDSGEPDIHTPCCLREDVNVGVDCWRLHQENPDHARLIITEDDNPAHYMRTCWGSVKLLLALPIWNKYYQTGVVSGDINAIRNPKQRVIQWLKDFVEKRPESTSLVSDIGAETIGNWVGIGCWARQSLRRAIVESTGKPIGIDMEKERELRATTNWSKHSRQMHLFTITVPSEQRLSGTLDELQRTFVWIDQFQLETGQVVIYYRLLAERTNPFGSSVSIDNARWLNDVAVLRRNPRVRELLRIGNSFITWNLLPLREWVAKSERFKSPDEDGAKQARRPIQFLMCALIIFDPKYTEQVRRNIKQFVSNHSKEYRERMKLAQKKRKKPTDEDDPFEMELEKAFEEDAEREVHGGDVLLNEALASEHPHEEGKSLTVLMFHTRKRTSELRTDMEWRVPTNAITVLPLLPKYANIVQNGLLERDSEVLMSVPDARSKTAAGLSRLVSRSRKITWEAVQSYIGTWHGQLLGDLDKQLPYQSIQLAVSEVREAVHMLDRSGLSMQADSENAVQVYQRFRAPIHSLLTEFNFGAVMDLLNNPSDSLREELHNRQLAAVSYKFENLIGMSAPIRKTFVSRSLDIGQELVSWAITDSGWIIVETYDLSDSDPFSEVQFDEIIKHVEYIANAATASRILPHGLQS